MILQNEKSNPHPYGSEHRYGWYLVSTVPTVTFLLKYLRYSTTTSLICSPDLSEINEKFRAMPGDGAEVEDYDEDSKELVIFFNPLDPNVDL